MVLSDSRTSPAVSLCWGSRTSSFRIRHTVFSDTRPSLGAPSTVSSLQVSASSDPESLSVSWQPGPGRTELCREALGQHGRVQRADRLGIQPQAGTGGMLRQCRCGQEALGLQQLLPHVVLKTRTCDASSDTLACTWSDGATR
ncbi:hypothetical protein CRUP_000847 [Coryphaenoides rupestris]|nr:hypothetical protein CRUP_000847 [Coryphaenoides rupestris]